MKFEQVELGQEYTDKLHGFTGIATAKNEYLNGCKQVCLEKLDGSKIVELWFDIQRLKPTKTQRKPVLKSTPTGGPQSHPPSRYHDGSTYED